MTHSPAVGARNEVEDDPMSQLVQTVTGPIPLDQLGRTLMHEHLTIAFPGWESDTFERGPSDANRLALCIERAHQLQDLGFSSMLDPCPNDLGRDVELMARVAQETGFQIVCATGLYTEADGGAPYWRLRMRFGASAETIAEMMVRELTESIGSSGVRAGVIKVGSGTGSVTDYERTVLQAAAIASCATGASITTHTEQGTLGDDQQRILTAHGVPPHRIVIGHSCGTSDHDYHMAIARRGSYLGFDRFGLEFPQPDAARVDALLAVLRGGAGDRVVVSHDSVWCWRGRPLSTRQRAEMEHVWNPSHLVERIVPRLLDGGASAAGIDRLLVENPRRFFAGEALPELPAAA